MEINESKMIGNGSDLLPSNFSAMVDLNYMSWQDYLAFASMMVGSALIGLYFGCFRSKNRNTSEFLVGGRKMGLLPVIMSLVASFISAIGLLGEPSIVYLHGVSFTVSVLVKIVSFPIIAFFILPVFFNYQITSVNEYLEARFDKNVRLMGAVFFLLQISFFTAVNVYAPSLAVAQMTGLSVFASIALICVVCMFYTTLGGIKAVMWTDVLQAFFMYAAVGYIAIKGTIEEGGLRSVIQTSLKDGRPGWFDFNFNPTVDFTTWTYLFGSNFMWISNYGINQTMVQRYISLSSLKKALKAVWVTTFLMIVLGVTLCYIGMVLYSKYKDCDPIASGIIEQRDQILPYYVMQNFGNVKGLSGFFVAAVFAASLSTISTGLNSLAAISVEDVIRRIWSNLSERRLTLLAKAFNFYYGLQTFGLALVASQLGGVISAVLTLNGTFAGPVLGIFTLGMFVPHANSLGTLVGGLTGLVLMGCLSGGREIAMYTRFIIKERPLTNICLFNDTTGLAISNQTVTQAVEIDEIPPFNFARELLGVSKFYYPFIGFLLVLLIGIPVSLCSRRKTNLRKLNPKLLSPLVIWCKKFCPGYETIGTELVPEECALMHPPEKFNEVLATAGTKAEEETTLNNAHVSNGCL